MKIASVVMNWCQPKQVCVRRLGKQLTAKAILDGRNICNPKRHNPQRHNPQRYNPQRYNPQRYNPQRDNPKSIADDGLSDIRFDRSAEFCV